MNFDISAWEAEDLPGMLKIWNAVVMKGNAFPQENPLDENSGKEFFGSQSFCGVFRQSPKADVQGLYILHPNNVGRCGHICNASYAVSENARGKGIGEILVRHSLDTARKLGFRILQFNAVVKDNYNARKLYKKLGFKEIGMLPGAFKDQAGIYKDVFLYYFDLMDIKQANPAN